MMLCSVCLNMTLTVRYDKKGRPYMSCGTCGCKIFLKNGMMGIQNYASISRMAAPHVDEIRQASIDYIRQHGGEMTVSNVPGPQPSVPAPFVKDKTDGSL